MVMGRLHFAFRLRLCAPVTALGQSIAGVRSATFYLQVTYDLRVAEIANASRIEREVMRCEGSTHDRCWPN